MKYRNNQGVGLFDKENTLQELLENGNPLPKLKEIIDFEQFRDFIMGEVRYNSLMKTFPQEAEELFVATERNAKLRYEGYKKLSEM